MHPDIVYNFLNQKNLIFVSNDKDFLNLWSKYQLKIILLSIHPATDPYILPRVRNFIESYEKGLPEAFLIILSQKSYHIRE